MPKPTGYFTRDGKKRPITGKQFKMSDFAGANENAARRRLLQQNVGPYQSNRSDIPPMMPEDMKRKVESYLYHQERDKYLPDITRNDQKSQEELGNKTGIHIPDGILKYIRAIGMSYALHDFINAVKRSTFDDPSPLNNFLKERYAFMRGYEGDQVIKKLLPDQKKAMIDVANERINAIELISFY